jgi:NAD(P)H-hydrate epimerase
VKYLSVRQAQELDRRAREEFAVPSLLLMERAADAVVTEAVKLGGSFVIAAGAGNNGGDGLAAARLLHGRGCRVAVWPLVPLDGLRDEPRLQARMIQALKIPLVDGPTAPVVVDAVFGIGLNRDVAGPAAEMIRRINASKKKVVSVDVPSGLDADTGRPRGVAVRASVTVTFGFPKAGFRAARAADYLGRLVVADIGYPRELLIPCGA